ncbi:hypothetical protein ACLB2K_023932 [Fragaria x ananassa]
MKKHVFSLDLFAFLLVAGLFASLSPLLLATPGDHPNYGAYRPIEDIHNPHVVEIAEFAVSELNKQFQKKLAFQSVVRGEKQVVAGENYKLVITVKDESSSVNYECVVWEKEEHGRSYTNNEEKVTLFAILKEEFDDIENFNSQEKHSFTLGLKAFSDLTYERVP